MLYDRLGLEKKLSTTAPGGTTRVRADTKSEPNRKDGMWAHVKVVKDHPS